MAIQSTNGVSYLERLRLGNAATDNDHAVRYDQLLTLLGGKSGVGHTHVAAQITDFAAAVDGEVGTYLKDSDTVVWSGARAASVRLKTGGGLLSGVAGVECDFGTGANQVARGNHGHAELHPAATWQGSNTIDGGINAESQETQFEVRLGPGLKVLSGVAADFGSGADQVARGNHTHGQLHDPVTVVSTASLSLALNGQQLSGVVNVDPSPSGSKGRLGIGSGGLYVELGSTADKAAAGNHGHAVVTTIADGFMSALDKIKLDLYGILAQQDSSVSFSRHDVCPAGKYIGGRHRWGQGMELRAIHLTAEAPGAECLVGLEVDGVVVSFISIPGGTAETEVTNYKALSGITVDVNKYVRVKMVSGVGTLEEEAARIDVSLVVRASVASEMPVADAILKDVERVELIDYVYDSDGILLDHATVLWPDLSGGVYTPVYSSEFYGKVDGFTITHANSGRTVTQPLKTRNSDGKVTHKPPMTVT